MPKPLHKVEDVYIWDLDSLVRIRDIVDKRDGKKLIEYNDDILVLRRNPGNTPVYLKDCTTVSDLLRQPLKWDGNKSRNYLVFIKDSRVFYINNIHYVKEIDFSTEVNFNYLKRCTDFRFFERLLEFTGFAESFESVRYIDRGVLLFKTKSEVKKSYNRRFSFYGYSEHPNYKISVPTIIVKFPKLFLSVEKTSYYIIGIYIDNPDTALYFDGRIFNDKYKVDSRFRKRMFASIPKYALNSKKYGSLLQILQLLKEI